MPQLETILQRCFHTEQFRPGQRAALETILAGRDVMAIWPTGAGKSLVYQMAAQLLPHLTIVVTPLISLMYDQIQRMRSLGFDNVAGLSSVQSYEANQQTLDRLRTFQLKVLFVTPERLNSDNFLVRLRDHPLSLLTIDEAHCICQWGHDFRPEYLRLGKAVQVLQPRSILALTATATPPIQEQIAKLLGMNEPHYIKLSLDRPNLHYSALATPRLQARDIALQHLLRSQGLPAIIYINQRQECENTAHYLAQNGLRAGYYHAAMRPEERQRVQEMFLNDELQVIAATTAFGMGVDKANVRQVIHLTPPNSLEDYYQESGRAGRDRQPAHCLLLYDQHAFDSAWQRLESKYPQGQQLEELYADLYRYCPAELRLKYLNLSPASWRQAITAILGHDYRLGQVQRPQRPLESVSRYLRCLQEQDGQRLQAMQRYATADRCRRSLLLEYFGERGADSCGNCDICLPPSPVARPRPWLEMWRHLGDWLYQPQAQLSSASC